MSGRYITLKYDKERYSDPVHEDNMASNPDQNPLGDFKAASPSPSTANGFHEQQPQHQSSENPVERFKNSSPPSIIVKLKYSKGNGADSVGSSPMKSSERRLRNRTPTPTPPSDSDKRNSSSNLSSRAVSPLSATPTADSDPTTLTPVTAEAAEQALKSLSESYEPAQYYKDVHVVASRLHLLKEVYRTVQALKTRRREGIDAKKNSTDTPDRLLVTSALSLTPNPEYSPASSPVHLPTTSPEPVAANESGFVAPKLHHGTSNLSATPAESFQDEYSSTDDSDAWQEPRPAGYRNSLHTG